MNTRNDPIPAVQWITAVAGALVIVATLIFLASAALSDAARPPEIQISHDAPVRVTGGYLVPIHVRNAGDETAADLRITGEMNGAVESAEVFFDYLPRYATRHAGLFFTRDPAGLGLTVRATSYTIP